MACVTFTGNLRRHVACDPCTVPGASVREALEAAFQLRPRLRGYVVDEHGALRFHMAVFVDGVPIEDRRTLGDPVSDAAQIYVMQALSGG
ncbi:MAG TPA: MoaD/ThiS family protein [Geothrix sp.]|nr:MoaD/ThiS family protein [Geothrix sp.]